MTRRAITTALTVALLASGCIGSTPEDRERDALPDDGLEEGPLHRAGQPCLLCHSSSGGEGPHFVVAGTVYGTDGVTGRGGVRVTLTDVTGDVWELLTNEAGNFMIDEREWSPVFPLSVDLSDGTHQIGMRSPISREGSCAHCHRAELSATSAGPVEVGAF
ncbi:MAG: hypothetical protein KC619_30150 [Myxococcales bacterium]|nr:hypothetical protein [Myxococcales bacterium]